MTAITRDDKLEDWSFSRSDLYWQVVGSDRRDGARLMTERSGPDSSLGVGDA
jgi:hypothetical protein